MASSKNAPQRTAFFAETESEKPGSQIPGSQIPGSDEVEEDSGSAAAMPWMLPAVEDVNPLGEVDFEDAGGDGDCILPD